MSDTEEEKKIKMATTFLNATLRSVGSALRELDNNPHDPSLIAAATLRERLVMDAMYELIRAVGDPNRLTDEAIELNNFEI